MSDTKVRYYTANSLKIYTPFEKNKKDLEEPRKLTYNDCSWTRVHIRQFEGGVQ